MPIRRVFSAANTLLHANKLRARPVMRGHFFMFVLSRVVVGLARWKKSRNGRSLFCTYKSILDFYVLGVNRARALKSPSGREVSQEKIGCCRWPLREQARSHI